MEIRILGRDLEVSEIGFGCMGMSHDMELFQHRKKQKN